MARRLLRLVLGAALLGAPPALGQGPIVAWTYAVRTGDTMSSIARAMGVSVEALAAANGMRPPYVLRGRQVLKRPDPAGAPPPRPVSLLPAPRPATASTTRPPNLSWPTSGAIVSRYGAPVKGLANNGFDLAALPGMAVYSAASGRVLFAGTEPERFGPLILIDHGGGWVTAYAYLGKVRVKEGDQVTRRQLIARIG